MIITNMRKFPVHVIVHKYLKIWYVQPPSNVLYAYLTSKFYTFGCRVEATGMHTCKEWIQCACIRIDDAVIKLDRLKLASAQKWAWVLRNTQKKTKWRQNSFQSDMQEIRLQGLHILLAKYANFRGEKYYEIVKRTSCNIVIVWDCDIYRSCS